MATTSLWHIKGRLKDLIDYVENPEKTAAKTPDLQDLYNVFSYVQRPEATQEGEYVTAVNCLKETALRQMILTKKRYGKTEGYIAWHGYQSFKPEEVTPQLAHEIGVKLAKELYSCLQLKGTGDDHIQRIPSACMRHVEEKICRLYKQSSGMENCLSIPLTDFDPYSLF